MGKIVNVKCENCNFEKNKMYLGGSMANHDVYSGFPYFCEECKDIFVGNYKDDNLSCSVCKSKNIVLYNDKRFRIVVEEKLSFWEKIFGKKEDTSISKSPTVFSWSIDEISRKKSSTFVLTNEYYKCPKCNEFSMKFEDVGLYD